MTPAEKRRLLVEWNATKRDYPRNVSVDELFAQQAARRPDTIAIAFGSSTLTYGELDAAASRIAAGLHEAGVRRGANVGISSERSIETIAGLLGILRAGAAYVPLDPATPAQRTQLLVGQANVSVVLDLDGGLQLPVGVRALRTRELLARRSMPEPIAHQHGSSDEAYVLFTSGSTGTPKAVCIEHRSIVRLVSNVEWATFSEDDVFLASAPLSFDASTLEIWGPLLHGAKLVIAPPGVLGLDELASAIRDNGATFIFMTTALFHQMVEHAIGSLGGVRQFFTGGEVLSPSHMRRFVREHPGVHLFAVYGPTENTTFSTSYRFRELAEGQTVPIGRPITNSTAYVLDKHGEPVAPGTPGELCTGGDGVARCYLGSPGLTAEKFIPDPFGSAGARLYRTGDLARWTETGELEFLGRIDQQVKIRGFRIEPGEIEAAVATAPGVREVVVIVREDVPGDKRLAAYVVGDGAATDADALKKHLGKTLPDYMIPSAFVVLASLPLTPNGKVDRKALPAPDFSANAKQYVAPRDPTEEALSAIFADVLHVARVSVDDSFFDLGGHSLHAMQTASRIRTQLGVDVPVRVIFEDVTVERLAERVRAASNVKKAMPALPIARIDRTKPIPASFAQSRLWFLDQLEGGADTSYNVCEIARLRGAVDTIALDRALQEVVNRHEALRTTFVAIDGTPHQVIHASVEFRLQRIEAQSEGDARAMITREAYAPYDLAKGPLFRGTLVHVHGDEHLLVLYMHHIATDGLSNEIVARELAVLYAAFAEG